jgi:hypothetical protein
MRCLADADGDIITGISVFGLVNAKVASICACYVPLVGSITIAHFGIYHCEGCYPLQYPEPDPGLPLHCQCFYAVPAQLSR